MRNMYMYITNSAFYIPYKPQVSLDEYEHSENKIYINKTDTKWMSTPTRRVNNEMK